MKAEDQKHKILIVEDEMIIAADLSLQLSKLGYEVIGIQARAEDAIRLIEDQRPDIVLMDIVLAGEMDGIDAAIHISNTSQVPVIFLTSNSDDATFKRAIIAKPYAFISKPFQKAELTRGIEIALRHIANEQETATKDHEQVTSLKDCLFIRQNDQMVKVHLKNILFLEADRNYCKVSTLDKEYLVTAPMGTLEVEIRSKNFFRVHRSYIVNLDKIDAFSDNWESLTINNHVIPVSRRNREVVLKYLNLL